MNSTVVIVNNFFCYLIQHCKRLSVILKLWNVVLRARVTLSSVGGEEGVYKPPHWPVNQNAE